MIKVKCSVQAYCGNMLKTVNPCFNKRCVKRCGLQYKVGSLTANEASFLGTYYTI